MIPSVSSASSRFPYRLSSQVLNFVTLGKSTYIKEYRPDGLHSLNPAYPVMHFSEFEHVYLIGQVIGVLNDEDVACEEDVECYRELHPEID